MMSVRAAMDAAVMAPVLVTGASGFIGGALTQRLLDHGRRVRVFTRRPQRALERGGVEVIVGELSDPAALRRACEGAGTVFHTAARVGVWGPAHDFFKVNVEGTRDLLAACRAAGVARFINTSSPSVVYTGGDLRGVNEDLPLCTAAPSAYPTSKAAAEQLVSAAHCDDFATVSLRPHLVFGPGDRNLIPRVIDLARRGRLKIIGDGRNRVDLTPIANVVDAHLAAERALATFNVAGLDPASAQHPGGRAYFITNGEPVVLWDWINALLQQLQLPPVTRRVSLANATRAGAVLETLWRVLPLRGEPPMSRFVAKELATDHWFDISAARRDLDYSPRLSVAEATAELVTLLRPPRSRSS